MSRRPRHELVVPGLPHHVVLRANNRRNLFASTHDRLRFLRFVADADGPGACGVLALALMTNHVHLLIDAPSFEETWRWIKRIAQRYAVHRNRERGASGKVFEQRYGLKAVTSERQLAATTAYIDLNPLRAGVDSPWTTRSLHAGEGKVVDAIRDVWRPSAWWLGLGESDAARHARYREFCELRQESWWPDVARPDGARPGPVTHGVRPNRPDRSKVA
jgi:putative transposase